MKVLFCAHNISSHIFVFCRHFILPTHRHTHTLAHSVLFALFLSFRITLFALPWIRRSFPYLRLFSSVFIEQRVHCLIFVNASFVPSLLPSFHSHSLSFPLRRCCCFSSALPFVVLCLAGRFILLTYISGLGALGVRCD